MMTDAEYQSLLTSIQNGTYTIEDATAAIKGAAAGKDVRAAMIAGIVLAYSDTKNGTVDLAARDAVNTLASSLESGGVWNLPEQVATLGQMAHHIETGTTPVIDVEPSSYTDYEVRFSRSFSSTPIVLATVSGSSTSTNYGLLSVAAPRSMIGHEGCVLRVYNTHTNLFQPRISWMAVEAVAVTAGASSGSGGVSVAVDTTLSIPGAAADAAATGAAISDVNRRIYETVSEAVSYVTPEQFGAAGDGITDDTRPLLAAINTGSTVLLAKRYKVGEFNVDKGANFAGINGATILPDKLIFNGTSKVSGVDFDYYNSEKNLPLSFNGPTNLRNCTFNGNNRRAFQSLCSIDGEGITVDGCKFVNSHSGRDGLALTNVSTGCVRGCYFNDIGGSAVQMYFHCKDVSITGNTIVDCNINTSLTDGTISTYGDYQDGIPAQNIIVTGNTIHTDYPSGFCFRLNGCENVDISGNIVTSSVSSPNAVLLIQDRTNNEVKVYNRGWLIVRGNLIDVQDMTVFSIQSSDADFALTIEENNISCKNGSVFAFGNSATPVTGRIIIKNNVYKNTAGWAINTNNENCTYDVYFSGNKGFSASRSKFKTTGEIQIVGNTLTSGVNHMINIATSEKMLVVDNVLLNTAQTPDIYKEGGAYLVAPSNTMINLAGG